MTAAYRMKGLGWFGACVIVVLAFYLVSLQVATERNRLQLLNKRIATAERDIRALETEFDTRSNLAQLEKWNGDTLALAAPTAQQFVHDEAQLAQMDVTGQGTISGPAKIQTAALLVPTLTQVVKPSPVNQVSVRTPAAPTRAIDMAQVTALEKHRVTPSASVVVAQTPMHDSSTKPATPVVAKVRQQAVAMLDRKLLSDNTLGDILSGARAESGRRR